jgi:nucleoside-diphosphate-sugar epimerase
MRVLVTGASGFIGARVTRALLAAAHEVSVLAVPDDPMRRLHDIQAELRVIHGDLGAMAEWLSVLTAWRPEACVHLAWYAEPGKYLHSSLNIPALMSSVALLEALIEIGCRQGGHGWDVCRIRHGSWFPP